MQLATQVGVDAEGKQRITPIKQSADFALKGFWANPFRHYKDEGDLPNNQKRKSRKSKSPANLDGLLTVP